MASPHRGLAEHPTTFSRCQLRVQQVDPVDSVRVAQRFYDSKTAQIRDFEPLVPGKVSLYYCGATVQGKPHVGHIRSAIVFDILIRWMEYSGFDVISVRNVTDIDDKILDRSAASYGEDFQPDSLYPSEDPWYVLAYRFERAFHEAYTSVGVRPVSYEPRATGHIPEMIVLIERLIEAGHAYPALDGSADVYFEVASWAEYGSLTRQSIDQMQDAADADPRGKKDPRDFALWKAADPKDPETAGWNSPWGRGRPGWHLECSAMSTKYLGAQFDIHGGGLDLRFPHHENELAQSTAAGDGFARYWLHNGLVTINGEKMSKSIGNIVTPEQMLASARPTAVRYFLGQAHYRSQLDYQDSSLQEAQAAVERIESFQARATRTVEATGERQVAPEFRAAMEDDLNVPQALAALHATVRAGNIALDTGDSVAAAQALDQVNTMVSVLGLDDVPENDDVAGNNQVLDAVIQAQLDARAQARADKDWATADTIRDTLAAAGITIEDTPSGAEWHLAERTSRP